MTRLLIRRLLKAEQLTLFGAPTQVHAHVRQGPQKLALVKQHTRHVRRANHDAEIIAEEAGPDEPRPDPLPEWRGRGMDDAAWSLVQERVAHMPDRTRRQWLRLRGPRALREVLIAAGYGKAAAGSAAGWVHDRMREDVRELSHSIGPDGKTLAERYPRVMASVAEVRGATDVDELYPIGWRDKIAEVRTEADAERVFGELFGVSLGAKLSKIEVYHAKSANYYRVDKAEITDRTGKVWAVTLNTSETSDQRKMNALRNLLTSKSVRDIVAHLEIDASGQEPRPLPAVAWKRAEREAARKVEHDKWKAEYEADEAARIATNARAADMEKRGTALFVSASETLLAALNTVDPEKIRNITAIKKVLPPGFKVDNYQQRGWQGQPQYRYIISTDAPTLTGEDPAAWRITDDGPQYGGMFWDGHVYLDSPREALENLKRAVSFSLARSREGAKPDTSGTRMFLPDQRERGTITKPPEWNPED